jgi:hypothetical protein
VIVNSDQDITLAEIDEALGYLREKVEDRYGNRLKWHQKATYWEQIDNLLEMRFELVEGKNDNNQSGNISVNS